MLKMEEDKRKLQTEQFKSQAAKAEQKRDYII
jgi:hypothetical protein